MIEQPDLFGQVPAPGGLPDGLQLWPDFVDAAEAVALARAVDAAPLTPFQFGPWEGKRLTASYGHAYDFSAARLGAAPPFPPWLVELAARAEAVAGLRPGEARQALLIRYDPGAGIGWHRDRPQFGTVLGLSLTSPVDLRLRRREPGGGFRRARVHLPVGSLYRLTGEVREGWEHSLAPVLQTRHSITLRTLRRPADGGS